MFTVVGVGSLLGAVVARRFAGWVGHGRALWLSIGLTMPFGLLMPLIAVPGWRLWPAAAGGVAVGFGIVAYNVIQVSFRQRLCPDHLLGRMNATMRFLVWGTLPLGALCGGALAEWLGVRTALLVAGLGACLAFLPVFWSPLRTMRTLPAATPTVEQPTLTM